MPSYSNLLAVLLAVPVVAHTSLALALEGRATVPFVAPASNGGSQLDSSAGLGEPLNVIFFFFVFLQSPQ